MGRRLLVLLGVVVLFVGACTDNTSGSTTTVGAPGMSTLTSTTELETTSTSSTSTSTSTTLPVETFDPRVIGSYVFFPVDWGIIVDAAGTGIHLVHMVVEVRPAIEGGIEYLEKIDEATGRLVWDEIAVDLCRAEDRTGGDPRLGVDDRDPPFEFRWIGDIAYTDEYCPDWDHFRAMQNAVFEFGLPEQGCISFVSDGVTHELCEPMNELPPTYQWNWAAED